MPIKLNKIKQQIRRKYSQKISELKYHFHIKSPQKLS